MDNPATIRQQFIKIMTGSDLSQRKIPIVTLKSKNPGPVIWLTACAHGDEVTGIVIIQELMRYIKKNGLLKGSIYAIPIMNTIGFENVSRHVTFSNEDLNRSFPGSPAGSLAERIAFRIFDTIMDTSPDLVIDLHNDWINSIPYALVDPVEEDHEIHETIIRYAAQSGLPVVVDRDLLRSSFSHSI